MTLQRQFAYWLVGLFFFVVLLWLLSGILLPFVAGMALAYMLDPIADRLERLGLGRVAATALIIGVALFAFAMAVLLLVPLIGGQIGQLASYLPDAVSRLEADLLPKLDWLREATAGNEEAIKGYLAGFAKDAVGWLASLAGGLLSGGMALIGLVSLLVVTPVVAFYLLIDWDNMVARIDGWLPLDHRHHVREIARDIDRAMAGFVRGQSLVCLLLGTFYAVALTAAGLRFGLLIGLGAGVISFIPYVGSVVGFFAAIGMAVAQGWPNVDLVYVLIIAGIFGVGQFLEGNIISPRLVGNSVGLHPVWLMFALFAFGYLFGFVGMLLAVPLAAAIGVVLRFMLRQYLRSTLYKGTGRGGPEPDAEA
jgi:predicted PurR-regulated permease PerM